MKSIKISIPEETANRYHVEHNFQLNNINFPIYFKNEQGLLTLTPEALLAAYLLPATKLGFNLSLENPISPQLAGNLKDIQSFYFKTHPSQNLKPIEVITKPKLNKNNISNPKRIGAFFSGGVDSFYTLLEHQDEITDLIFIHGFDILPESENTLLSQTTLNMVATVAKEMGKNAIIIKTNLKPLLDAYLDWAAIGYGVGLFTIAHLLSPVLKKIYIPSSMPIEFEKTAIGSSPSLDPLWSTEQFAIIYDDNHFDRLGKIKKIAINPLVLKHLRVCWENPKGEYNCCKCEKCIRTMICLQAVNGLKNSSSFSNQIDINAVKKISFHYPSIRKDIQACVELLKSDPTNQDLIYAIETALQNNHKVNSLQQRVRFWLKKSPLFYSAAKKIYIFIKINFFHK